MKKQKLIVARAYFTDAEIPNRLKHIAKVTGLSMSNVVAMSIRFGITQTEERLLDEKQLQKKAK